MFRASSGTVLRVSLANGIYVEPPAEGGADTCGQKQEGDRGDNGVLWPDQSVTPG